MNSAVEVLLGVACVIFLSLVAWLTRRVRLGSRTVAVRWRVEADQRRPDDSHLPQNGGWTNFTMSGDLLGGYSAEVADPSVVVLRLRNAGRRRIRNDDWETRLAFTFPGRTVIATDTVLAPAGQEPAEQLIAVDFGQPRESVLAIREVRLEPRDKAVRLGVLLSGPGHGIEANGALRGGRIVQERRRRRRPIALAVPLPSPAAE